MRATVTILLALLSTSQVVDGRPQLVLSVSPRVATAPATLHIQVRVERSRTNRALLVTADSQNFYRSSVVPLEGENAPSVVTVEYREVPSGSYVVSCTLIDGAGGQRAAADTSVAVVGAGTPAL